MRHKFSVRVWVNEIIAYYEYQSLVFFEFQLKWWSNIDLSIDRAKFVGDRLTSLLTTPHLLTVLMNLVLKLSSGEHTQQSVLRFSVSESSFSSGKSFTLTVKLLSLSTFIM